MARKRKNMISCMRSHNLTEAKNGYVARYREDDTVYIHWKPVDGVQQVLTGMSTRDARLLAKRINQFLDAGG